MNGSESIVEVKNLTITDSATDRVIASNISFELKKGEILGFVGESGSGKTLSMKTVVNLLPSNLVAKSDKFIVLGNDYNEISENAKKALIGKNIGLVPQNTVFYLHPMFKIKNQIADGYMLYNKKKKSEGIERAKEKLRIVGFKDPDRILESYPWQLSGGMRQRVNIALALMNDPQIIIADEPTTALDVTVQAQILALISELQKEIGMAVLFITHDMGVVAQIADRVAVMRYGEIVESGTAQAIFAHPQHPYTQALLSAVPRLGALKDIEHPCFFRLIDPDNGKVIEPPSDKLPPPGEKILEVKNLVKTFPVRTDFWGRPTYVVRACDHVSFDLRAGETLSIVGESGCGKSTTGRAVLRLLDVDSGEVLHRGKSLLRMTRHELQEERRNLQMIFQDPYASLDPRQTVGYSIAEPMMIHNYCSKKEMYDRVALLLKRVGLSPDMANRYPHEFSGGQRQRICIARALSLKPQIIVADECVAALDVSIRAQVVNLMMELQEEMGLSYIFISHDMGVVERISHRVAVMYLGQIVEMGSRRAVLGNPLHPYTQKLLSAVPIADPQERNLLKLLNLSDLPSPVRKVGDDPVIEPLVEVEPGHFVAKHVVGTMEGHK